MNEAVQKKSGNFSWTMFVKGLALIFLSILAFLMPGITLALIFSLLAIYLFVDGIVEVIHGIITYKYNPYWGWSIVKGLLLVLAGIFIFSYPGVGLLTIGIIIGISFIVRGIYELSASSLALYTSAEKVMLVIVGILSILLGLAILFNPYFGTIVLVWLVSLYALTAGILTIAVSFHAGSMSRY